MGRWKIFDTECELGGEFFDCVTDRGDGGKEVEGEDGGGFEGPGHFAYGVVLGDL